MSALSTKLRPAAFPLFDYAGLNDSRLENEVRASTTRIRELQRAAIVEIGRELIAVKGRLPHGKFLEWIEAEFGWGRRTAINYMQVAAELGEKWATVAHLPPGTLYLLAAPSTPAEVRETVLSNLGPGQVVSTANVRELIDSVKSSEFRKRRRDHREEEQKQREANQARWQIQYDKDRARLDAENEKARAACEQVRSFLDGHYPAVCELLAGVTRHAFTDALFRMAESDRNRRNAEGRQ